MPDRNADDFDPTRPLVMNRGARLNDHELPRLAPVRVVDEPTDERGAITAEIAARLWAAGRLDYADDLVATPVETPEAERNRLAAERVRDSAAAPDDPDALVPTDDLVIWAVDDEQTGKKAGQKVTNDDLRVIAEREGAAVETDDNKADLIRKIMERRALVAQSSDTADRDDDATTTHLPPDNGQQDGD